MLKRRTGLLVGLNWQTRPPRGPIPLERHLQLVGQFHATLAPNFTQHLAEKAPIVPPVFEPGGRAPVGSGAPGGRS